jgi:hypothetical protein
MGYGMALHQLKSRQAQVCTHDSLRVFHQYTLIEWISPNINLNSHQQPLAGMVRWWSNAAAWNLLHQGAWWKMQYMQVCSAGVGDAAALFAHCTSCVTLSWHPANGKTFEFTHCKQFDSPLRSSLYYGGVQVVWMTHVVVPSCSHLQRFWPKEYAVELLLNVGINQHSLAPWQHTWGVQ